MENKLIELKITKENLLALPEGEKIDFLGAVKDIDKNFVDDLKKSLIAQGDKKIEGKYYKATISGVGQPKPKIVYDWNKIINYAKLQKLAYVLTVDKEATQKKDWFIKNIKNNQTFYKVEQGKPSTGKVLITRKENK